MLLDIQLEEQEFEDGYEKESGTEDEDGPSGELETLSDGSISATEHYETPNGESDTNNGHRPDVESNDDNSFSSQERENSGLLNKNEKLLAILSQKKRDAFDKLPKRMDANDSSQSQEGELM